MTAFDPSPIGVAGAILGIVALVPLAVRAAAEGRAPAGWATLAWVATVAGALAGDAAVLAVSWLALGVAVCALDEAPRFTSALAVGADLVAAAAVGAFAVDTAGTVLPWADGPAAPAWVFGMVALAVSARAALSGRVATAPLVLGLTVAIRLSDRVPPDVEWLLVVGVVGLVAVVLPLVGMVRARAWASPAPAAPLALLGFAAWGAEQPGAQAAALALLAGAALVASLALLAPAEARRGAAVAASTGGLVAAFAVPLPGSPASLALALAGVALAGLLVTVRLPAPPPWRPGAVRRVAGLTLVLAAAAPLLVPEAWWWVVGPSGAEGIVGDSAREALLRGRSGLVSGLGLGLVVAAAVSLGDRWRSARPG